MTTSTSDDNEISEKATAEEPEGASGQGGVEDAAEAHRYLKGVIEALIFVAEAPLTPKELARAAKIDRKRTTELVEELVAEYSTRGLQLQEVAGGYCFRSNPEFAAYVKTHLAQRPVRLSRAQLETLSIIAYRQPITRPEVDDIRGVDSGPVLKGLLERDLIKILGKKDEPGRPMLYGTTVQFLELFNMRSLQDLPTLKEFTELTDDSRRRFEKSLGEDAPEGPIDATLLADAAAQIADGSGDQPESEQPATEPSEDDDDEEEDDDDEDEDGEDEDEDGEDDDDEDDEDDDKDDD